MNEVDESLDDMLLGVLSCDGGRDLSFERILKLMEKPDYLEFWTRKISVDILVHLSLVVIDDGEGFDNFHEFISILSDSSQFQFMVDEKELNSDAMADLVDKVGDVLDKPYALIYAMLFKIIARGQMPALFFLKGQRLDHIGVLLALSQSCSTETEENALSAIFNFGVVSNALELIVDRDNGYLIRLAKIVMEGLKTGKSLALTMLAQLVYKNIDRKKALSARSLKLIPYLTQLFRDRDDQELRSKAIKLLSGLADLSDNKIDFVTSAGTQSILPDLFNVLDEDYSESRDFAILILWSLATEHKANQELFFMPQYRLVPRLERILKEPNESMRNALGLLSVIFENSKLSEKLLEENILPPLILSIAANESQDSIRANAVIIVSKMAESSIWKQLLVAQGNELLDDLFSTASNEQFKVSRDFAVRALYSLANEYPIISKYCFKFVTKFLDILEKDETANKFKLLQFIGSVLSNEENQRTVLYEAQRKNAIGCLLYRIISLVLAIINSANGSCVVDSGSSPLVVAAGPVATNANLVAMTKSVAIDVIRALCDKNMSLQHMMFHSKFHLIEALGVFLDQPDPIQGNHDPKVVALIVLYNLAGNDDLKSDFVDPKLNLLGRILHVLLLPSSSENSRAKSFATGTICRLVSKHTDNQILFANPSLGVLPILISSIRNPDTPWKAKEFALGALVHIAKLPANHWVAFDPEMALFSTTFDLLRDVKKEELLNANGSNKKSNNRFYVLGVIDDLLEAYDRPDGSQINTVQREALLKELYEIASEEIISPTKAKAMRLLLILSASNGFILTIQSHRVDLVQSFVSFLSQLCEPLSTAVLAQNLGEKSRRIYLSCISQFTNIKRVKAITSFLRTESLHLFPTLYRFLTLSSTSHAEEALVSSILWNMAENGDQNVSTDLVRHNIHVFAVDLLQETIRRRSEMDEFRTQLLNMLMNMARHFSVRESLINAGAVEVAEKLLDYHHRESSLSSSVFSSLLDNASTPSTRETAGSVEDTSSNAINHSSGSGGVTPLIRNNNPMNSLKALLILLFLFGNEEAKDVSSISPSNNFANNNISPKTLSIAERVVTTDRLKTLMDIFSLTLQCRGGKDFLLGTFCLPLIVDACLVISQSDSNKTALISLGVVPLLTKILVMYANNQSAIPNCGGGGNDDETATLAVETLLHLSFSFGSSNIAMQEAFLKGNTLLIEILPELQEKSNLPLEAKNKAVILQYRLTTTEGRNDRPSSFNESSHSIESRSISPVNIDNGYGERHVVGGQYAHTSLDVRRISMADASALTLSDPHMLLSMQRLPSSSKIASYSNSVASPPSLIGIPPKHVMLSYCWDPTANPGYVKKLGQELKRLGFDVWRDEDGSSLLPALSGAIDDRLAEAIEKSHTIVICVSAAYKRSSSCRLEATYAHALFQRNKVKIIYVMMNEHYTTISSPAHCDGWLGFMIGDNLWYSMWHENRIVNVANELAKILPEQTKLSYREKLTGSSISNPNGTPAVPGNRRQSSHSQNHSVINNNSSNLNNINGSGNTNDPESHSNSNNITAFVQHENPMFQQQLQQGQGRRLSTTYGSNHSLTNNNHVTRSVTRDSNENQDEDYESITSFSMEDIYSADSVSEKVEEVSSKDTKSRSFEEEKDTSLPQFFTSSTATAQQNRTAMGRQSRVLHNARRESHAFASAHSNLTNNNPNAASNNNSNCNNNETSITSNTAMTSNPLSTNTRRQSALTNIPSNVNRSDNNSLHAEYPSKTDDSSASNSSNSYYSYRSPLQQIFNSQPLPHLSGKRGSISSSSASVTSSNINNNKVLRAGNTISNVQDNVDGTKSSTFPPNLTFTPPPRPQQSSQHLFPSGQQAPPTNSTTAATAEDTMTEITSEDDALSAAFRLLFSVELVKDAEGLQEYLLEEGINTVELLGYCDPEDWQHIASFLRNKPRKRFLELMHQWHVIQHGNRANHQLLATPPVGSNRPNNHNNHINNNLYPTQYPLPPQLQLLAESESSEDYRIGLPSIHNNSNNPAAMNVKDNNEVPPGGNIFCSLPELESCVIS